MEDLYGYGIETIRHIFDLFVKPFKENFWFFLVIWFLSISPAIVFFISIGNDVRCLNFCAKAAVISYLTVFPCGLFKKPLSTILMSLFTIASVLSLFLDTAAFEICRCHFTPDNVVLILGTNADEAADFVSSYLSPSFFAVVLISLAISFLLYIFRVKISTIAVSIWSYIAAFFVVLMSFCSCSDGYSDIAGWKSVSYLKTFMFFETEPDINLEYKTPAPVVKCKGDLPANVVVIIGESLSKFHCSLYGYEKETMPMLQSLKDKDSLLLYTEVSSAYCNTVRAMELILSEMNPDEDESALTARNTVFDYLRSGGYQTIWLSNQSPRGLVDNKVTRFANLADTVVFVGDHNLGLAKKDYDEILLPVFRSLLNTHTRSNSVYFIHMMGSHVQYANRYPEVWDFYKEDDYASFPENQRKILSAYDNSIRYNDNVVYSLIEMAKAKESIVLYFPDHGQDIFQTDPLYCGHARNFDNQSYEIGTSIPFLIYCTASYREKFPEIYNTLVSMNDQPFNTSDFIPFLLQTCNLTVSE